MNSAKKISFLLRNLQVYGVVFLGCTYLAISQDSLIADSNKVPSTFQSTTNQNKINYQEQLVNFYKADSITPLYSTEGFFPTLFHDFGEQAAAPFHFRARQWLITGVSIGITATLIHFDGEIDEWARVQKQEHHWINKSSPFITKFGDNSLIPGY